MHTKIKICGIKTIEEVRIVNQFPVSFMGLIFAPSKRQVNLEIARNLVKNFRKDIEPVGVFVNESVENINQLIGACGLKIVQLHGEETVDKCRSINAKVWKSISIKDEKSLINIEAYAPYVEGILLDTYSKDEKGGTGKVFNWELVKDLSKKYKIILAGGLTPDNAVEAIQMVHPQIIDLNSGLETNLMKDETKIRLLFEKLSGSFE